MNAMEFINDEYASWDITYFMNGALLNRIPLIKKLKWREVFSFRGMFGHLTDKNNPYISEQNEGLFFIPHLLPDGPVYSLYGGGCRYREYL